MTAKIIPLIPRKKDRLEATARLETAEAPRLSALYEAKDPLSRSSGIERIVPDSNALPRRLTERAAGKRLFGARRGLPASN